MKRFFVLTAALLLVLCLLSGCTVKNLLAALMENELTPEPEPTSAPAAQVGNPLRQVSGPADFLPLGVVIDAPKGAESVRYTVIADTIAEIGFAHSGCSFTLRAARGEGDISGVYLDFVSTEKCPFEGTGLAATLSTAADGATLILWQQNGISYSLFTPTSPAAAVIPALVKDISGMTLTLPAGGEVPEAGGKGEAPAPTAAPQQSAPQQSLSGKPLLDEPIDFLKELTTTYDIDGDGTKETVTVVEYQDSYGMDYTYLEITDNGKTVSFGNSDGDMPQYAEALCLMDVIPGDPYVEIILSGDMMSADYITHIFRYDGKTITPATTVNDYDGKAYTGIFGRFYGMGEDGTILIDRGVDALGSMWAMRDFVHEGNMRFGYAPGSTWVRLGEYNGLWDGEYGPALTVKLPLPVYLSDTAPEVLAPGEKIIITETDRESFVYFITQKGAWGRIDVEWKKNDYRGYIGGLPEDDYFEYIPYAG